MGFIKVRARGMVAWKIVIKGDESAAKRRGRGREAGQTR